MDLNAVKKALYKEKPIALKTNYKGDFAHYVAQLSNLTIVEFMIPLPEATFENNVPAQLLIRWISIK